MEPARPLQIAELTKRAETFTFNPLIPLKYWIRTAEFLRYEADNAIRDGIHAQAYIMLLRYSVLILEYLPTHPEYKASADKRRECKSLAKKLPRAFNELEILKPAIEKKYNEWQAMRPAGQKDQPIRKGSTYADFAAVDPALSGNAQVLDPSEQRDWAVQLANQELARRDTTARATRRAGIPQGEVDQRRQGGRWDQPAQPSQGFGLQAEMEAARRNLDSRGGYSSDQYTQHERDEAPIVSQTYSYPTINKSRPVAYDQSPSQETPLFIQPLQPSRPPKEPLRHELRDDIRPPEIPRKQALDDHEPLIPESQTHAPPALPPKTSITSPPLPSKEHQRFMLRPSRYLENGEPLRCVYLPGKLKKEFLEIAAKNTARKTETCGILMGRIMHNAWFVQRLVIPDQIGTPDTCEAINEEKYVPRCIDEGLQQCGWIHTHPTQTCFLSSRDLHTHVWYQHLLPEAIAVVCAPKAPAPEDYGIFRLTNPPGLDYIMNCQRPETFHPHDTSKQLFRFADDKTDGHVIEVDNLEFDVWDVRDDDRKK